MRIGTNKLLGALASVLFSFGTNVQAQSGAQLDQSYVPTDLQQGLGIRDTTFYRNQTFTAGQTGLLPEIELFVSNCSTANDANIVVSLRAGTDINNPVLGTREIAAGSVPYISGCTGSTSAFARAALTPAPLITAGQVYSIWAHSADFVDEYGWFGDVVNVYPAGTARTNAITDKLGTPIR